MRGVVIRQRSIAVAGAIALAITPVAGALINPAVAAATASGLRVSVAYAENIPSRPAPANAFPVPWAGAPNTAFLGNLNPNASECGSISMCYDAGGIRLDNPTSAAITVTSVVVDVHAAAAGGKLYNNLWGSFSVPAGKSVILSENPPNNNPGFDNFDSSDSPHGLCAVGSAPTVKLVVGGVATTLVDSTHVLDTGGVDAGGCAPVHNESVQWRQIGAAGTTGGSVVLAPATITRFTGQQVSETATVLDGSGVGLPNASVTFSVTSGPDAGLTASAITDAAGRAAFTYSAAAQGEDVVVAGVTTTATFSSNPARVMWTNASAAGWSSADVGNPTPAGSESFAPSTGTWTVNGGGSGLSGTADHLRLVWRGAPPGGGIAARVVSQTNTGTGARAGVMLRASSAAGSPYYAALIAPGGGVLIQDRTVQGGTTTTVASVAGTPPAFLWVAASSSGLTAYTSADGYYWRPVAGSTVTLGLGSSPLAGLAVSSGSSAQLSTATFDSVAVSAASPPPQPPVSCPAPWTCTDIGAPAGRGSASVMNGETWTIQGAGSDIHGTADQFQYDWRALPADGGVSAHVTAQTNTNAWAKAGVMLRASTDPGAANYALLVTPANGIVVQYRPSQGATTTRSATLAGTVPAYLRVTRAGTVLSAYTSADGVAWTLVPKSTITLASMTGGLLEGLAVTSHNGGVLCTVTMDAVRLS
jgi:hypothetical protein